MKRSLNFCFCGIFLLTAEVVFAQAVPNGGFESWTLGEPDHWFTSNTLGFGINVTPATPPYSGSLAVRGEVISILGLGNLSPLVVTDIAGAGFPVVQSPAMFNFYYKFNKVGSTAYFLADAELGDSGGNGVALAYTEISTPAASFTLASVPFVYLGGNPVEALIVFSIDDTIAPITAAGNYFIVDEVSFSGTVGSSEASDAAIASVIEKVAPQPAIDFVTVYYSLDEHAEIRFEIMNLDGKAMKEFRFPGEIRGRHKVDLDIGSLPPGIYLLKMITGHGTTSSRICIAR